MFFIIIIIHDDAQIFHFDQNKFITSLKNPVRKNVFSVWQFWTPYVKLRTFTSANSCLYVNCPATIKKKHLNDLFKFTKIHCFLTGRTKTYKVFVLLLQNTSVMCSLTSWEWHLRSCLSLSHKEKKRTFLVLLWNNLNMTKKWRQQWS